MTMRPEEEREIMDMVIRRLKLQPELIESVERLKAAKTMKEEVETFDIERQMILEGDRLYLGG